MDDEEIRKSAALEDKHWWYSGRRAMVRRTVRSLTPGRALDVGCGSGGNTSVLRDLGWQATGLDYSVASTEGTRARGLPVVRGDARRLPFPDGTFDLVISTDAWEHVLEHELVAAETFRVLRPGGRALVAVPADMALWSGHDVALGHHRRYDRAGLVGVVEGAGFSVERLFSWNVLLRPVARMRRRRRSTSESEMEHVHPLVNAGLRTVVAAESRLPVGRRRGISLVLIAKRP